MMDWDRGLATCQHCGEILQLHTYKPKNRKEHKTYKRPVWTNNTRLSDKLIQWFEARGISQITLMMMKITEAGEWMPQTGKEENTIQFNYFRDRQLINVKYRDARKNFKMHKDAEKILYNLDCCRASTDVVIVEGEIDCLSYIEAGIINTVSLPNGSTLGHVNLEYIDNCIDYFENKTRIYLALDADEAGQNVTKELIRRFGAEKCLLVDLADCKDANEYLVRYGKEKLKATITQAREVPIEGVTSLMDWETRFDEYVVNGMKRGYVTGIKGFDNIFSTYTGQYIVVTGKPSSGKSDFVDNICINYNRLYGWKTAYASPENKPGEIHAGKLISKVCGKWINKRKYLAEPWLQKAKWYINDNFKFIDLDSYDLDQVLEKTRQVIFKFGIKVLVIDPYNKVRLKRSLDKNINEYTNDYLIAIDEFARRHDILIILVAHPVKPVAEERKNYEPDFYSIKGGGEFYDMSPHGLLVHRDYENNLVKIKVLKVKYAHLGTNNAHVYLRWNNDNGRYIDFNNQSEKPESVSSPIIDDSNWIEGMNG